MSPNIRYSRINFMVTLCAAHLLGLGTGVRVDAAQNIVRNGSMESGPGNGPTGIDDWLGFNDQQKSQDFAYHGTSSVRVGLEYPISGLFQNMDTLSEGDRILLVARVYQSSANPLVAGDRAGIKLEFYPPGGGCSPPPHEHLPISQSFVQDQWIFVQLTGSGITVPEGVDLVRVVMILVGNSDSTGAVYFDSAFAGSSGGENRLANASFENGPGGPNGIDDWTEFGSGGATAQKSGSEIPAHDGNFTVKATGPAVTGLWQEVPVTACEAIDVSALLYVSSAEPLVGTTVAGVKVEWISSSIPAAVDITPGASANTITAASPTDQWIDLFIDYTMPPGTDAGVRFVALLDRDGGTVGAAYFDACEAVVYTQFDGADVDNDDDEDLRDFAGFQDTFSGSGEFATEWLATVFDHDEDGDVDLTDYEYFWPRMTGANRSVPGGADPPSGTDCQTDSDGDRIPDAQELNRCMFPIVPCGSSRTDPNDADTDDDGITDGDEVLGTKAVGTNGLDLRGLGANPCHKDIFLEIDWVSTNGMQANRNKPDPAQIGRVVAAFAAAPVTNPDGITGIKLHVDTGQAPYREGNHAGVNLVVNTTTSLGDEFLLIKKGDATHGHNFDCNRHGYFHYCISAERFSLGGTLSESSGFAEISGDDLILSFGFVSQVDGASSNHQIVGNTIMHELGHNLNFRHGGNEDKNFKPNYNSIMNYRYQFVGIDSNSDSLGDGALDYSRGDLADLDENHLDERRGTGDDLASPDIDWNTNGAIENDVERNITCDVDVGGLNNEGCAGANPQSSFCGDDPGSADNENDCDILTGFNDWAAVVFTGISDADRRQPEVISCTLPPSRAYGP